MKALTICQPYAELIVRGDKRVENRRWPTRYRGQLLIHAGKSRDWLDLDAMGLIDETYDIPLSEMVFGAIVGIATLADCVEVRRGPGWVHCSPMADQRWTWLRAHEHTEGPFCWVLGAVRRLATPIPYRGAQGLFEVSDPDVLARIEKELAIAQSH